ncbi:MAG: tripartite tricarboxylate transporter substrate binding protein [Burkholderiaceae bacterium]
MKIVPTLRSNRRAALVLGAALACSLQPAFAQPETYPSKPLEVIVPWGPGGGSDITGRMVSKYLEAELKVPVPVVNLPGASGTIGVQRLLSKPADGYSVVVTGDFYALIGGDAPKWKLDDFIPLGVLINQPGALFVATDSRFKSWADVEREAKAKPGSISIFMAGRGIIDEVHTDYLLSKGISLNVIPVAKPAERYTSILGGHGDLLYEQAGDVKSFIESNKIRPLLSLTEQRFPLFKDVPTSKELGYDIWTPQIRWIFMRAGTDPARVQVIADALAKMAASDEYKAYLKGEWAAPDSFVPAKDARAYIQKTLDNVSKEAAAAKKGAGSR